MQNIKKFALIQPLFLLSGWVFSWREINIRKKISAVNPQTWFCPNATELYISLECLSLQLNYRSVLNTLKSGCVTPWQMIYLHFIIFICIYSSKRNKRGNILQEIAAKNCLKQRGFCSKNLEICVVSLSQYFTRLRVCMNCARLSQCDQYIVSCASLTTLTQLLLPLKQINLMFCIRPRTRSCNFSENASNLDILLV